MKIEREMLERRKREADEKARSLRSFVKELTATCAHCGTEDAVIHEDLVRAQNDAQFYEEEAARLGESLTKDGGTTFWVHEDAAGEWRWHLRAANNRIIADSGEGYKNKQDCLHAIELVKGSASAAVKEKKD